MIVIRFYFILQAYLSEPSLICDFCPSDQRFAYSFFQILPHDKHPCCSAIHFPLSGHVRDLHPLEFAHAGQTKTKQFLKALGWILIIADAVAFFIGGKTMLVIFIMALLITYAVYIKYYPYIFIEVTTKKGQELAYQLPFMGAAIAMLLFLNTSKLFNYEFGNYMKITAIITALLALPFIIKSLKTDVPQKFGRKLSVVFAAFIIAFTINFPINFLFTFDGATHEIAIVTDKKISSGKTRDRELYVSCNGKREIYTVSNSEYENTSIGDSKRICRRKSALGLEYSTIHD